MLAVAAGEVRPLTAEQRGGGAPRGLAAAVGRRRQRQDVGARRALRAGGARGRRRARADPRDHVHRARRRRAARARARRGCWSSATAQAARDTEAAFVGPSTASARGCCARIRSPPGWTRSSRSSTRGGRAPARTGLPRGLARVPRRPNGAGAVDLVAAYGVDRVRAMIEQVYRSCAARASAAAPAAPGARADMRDGAPRGTRRAGRRCGGGAAGCSTTCWALLACLREREARSCERRLRRPRAARAAPARRARGVRAAWSSASSC